MSDREYEMPDLLDLDEFDEEALKKESEEVLEMRLISSENAVFTRTAGGFLALKFKEKEYDRVGVYLTFPLTNPEEYISIREADEKAREIGVIEKLSELSPERAKMLKEQLDLRYFTPEITKIFDIKTEYGYGYFHVMTTYGECRFTIHNGGSSVVSLTDTRIIINDLDGNRFEVPDIMKLTVAERKKLDLFI